MIGLWGEVPAYRGSSGKAEFRLPSGQRVTMFADDDQVVAELKRRKLWEKARKLCATGTNFAILDPTRGGVDFFLWFGQPDDGGFLWQSFPGATLKTAEVRDCIGYLQNMLLDNTPRKAGEEAGHGHA